MRLIREVTNGKKEEDKDDSVDDKKSDKKPSDTDADAPPTNVAEPAVPEKGWNVAHLANHGMIISCDGFSLKLDLEQLNVLFDLAEDGETGEVRDHSGKAVSVEVEDDRIILSRDDDETYPNGVVLDLDTLKEMGIEQHTDAEAEVAADADEGGDPEAEAEGEGTDVTIATGDEEDDDLQEGIKKAFRRSGTKIKRGFRVTSGWRKGRVIANPKTAFKPRPKAKTRMKLKIASKKKRLIRILKSRRTRRKPASKRLRRLNKT